LAANQSRQLTVYHRVSRRPLRVRNLRSVLADKLSLPLCNRGAIML
jgi:hypothetical protein